MRKGVGGKLGPERREVLEKESGEVTIFTKRQQVLLVQGVNIGLRILLDDAIGDDDRPSLVSCTNPVHGETSGKTGDGPEERLESFGQMVRDVVFVDLNHRPPRAFFVVQFRFSADTDDAGIVRRTGYKTVD